MLLLVSLWFLAALVVFVWMLVFVPATRKFCRPLLSWFPLAVHLFYKKPLSRFSGQVIRERRLKEEKQLLKWTQLIDERKEAEAKLKFMQEEANGNVARIRERLGELREQAKEFEGVARREKRQQMIKETKQLSQLEAELNRKRAQAKAVLLEYDQRIEEAARREGHVIPWQQVFGDYLTIEECVEREQKAVSSPHPCRASGQPSRETSSARMERSTMTSHAEASSPKDVLDPSSLSEVFAAIRVVKVAPQKSPKNPTQRIPKLPVPPSPSPSLRTKPQQRQTRSHQRVGRNSAVCRRSSEDALQMMPTPVRLPPPTVDVPKNVLEASATSDLKPLYPQSRFHVPRLDLQWESSGTQRALGDDERGVYPRSDTERRERYRLAEIFSIPDLEHRGAEMERHLASARDSGGTPRKLSRIQMLIEQQSYARESRRHPDQVAKLDTPTSSRPGRFRRNGREVGQQHSSNSARV